MKLLEALDGCYAVKQLSDEKITAGEVKTLLNATHLSASSYGLQPYNIIVGESIAILKQLLAFSYGQEKIAESSHLIIFTVHTQVGDLTVDRYIEKHAKITHTPYPELDKFSDYIKLSLAAKTSKQKQQWAHQQAYIALSNFLTCAAMMRINSFPMIGFDNAAYGGVLGLFEKGLTITVTCSIGRRHPNDVEALNQKVRFDYDQIVMEMEMEK